MSLNLKIKWKKKLCYLFYLRWVISYGVLFFIVSNETKLGNGEKKMKMQFHLYHLMWLKLAAIYTTEWMIQKKQDGHHIMATTLFILTTCQIGSSICRYLCCNCSDFGSYWAYSLSSYDSYKNLLNILHIFFLWYLFTAANITSYMQDETVWGRHSI